MKFLRMSQTLSIFFSSFHTKYSLYRNLTFVFLFPFTPYNLNIRCGFNVVFVCLFAITVPRTEGAGMSLRQRMPSSVLFNVTVNEF